MFCTLFLIFREFPIVWFLLLQGRNQVGHGQRPRFQWLMHAEMTLNWNKALGFGGLQEVCPLQAPGLLVVHEVFGSSCASVRFCRDNPAVWFGRTTGPWFWLFTPSGDSIILSVQYAFNRQHFCLNWLQYIPLLARTMTNTIFTQAI